MCGIFGVVSERRIATPRAHLELLTDSLAHRGPDARGSYMDDLAFLGHRRLSVIDVQGGAQPMKAGSGRYVIVYNGEIYNFREIREELIRRQHMFKTTSDTEVVLHAYIEWGASSVERFNGMFAFAIWDTSKQELFLARDRLGIKPLYYTFVEQQILFASEMKAIVRHPQFQRKADLGSLSSYLSLRTTLGENTVFSGLKSLQAGHYLFYKAGSVNIRRYWDVPVGASEHDMGEAHYLTRTRQLLQTAVERRLISDVPVGAYLSGGLDSSLIASFMSQSSDQPIRTYSIGFNQDEYDEGPFAETVSQHLGTVHCHLQLSANDYFDRMDAAIAHRDQPLSIPHEIALFDLSKRVKQDVTVCLSGEGADELFGGYGRVQRSPMDYRKLKLFQALPASVRALAARFIRDDDIRKRLSLNSELEHFLHVYHWWPLDAKSQLFSTEVNRDLEADKALMDYLKDIFFRLSHANPYERIFYIFEKIHLQNLLQRLDMQSMAAGVEARVPFVDHELVEFASTIPLHHKLRWKSPLHMMRGVFRKAENFSEKLDTTKYLLRKLGDERLPRQISRRKKQGFPVPLDAWFGGSIKQLAQDILLDNRTRARGVFDMQTVETLLQGPARSQYDFHGKRIWMLMNVEIWFRKHIDDVTSIEN